MSKFGLKDSGMPQTYVSARILGLLYSPPFPDPDPCYSANEISCLLGGLNTAEVNLILYQLLDDGIVTCDTKTYNFK